MRLKDLRPLFELVVLSAVAFIFHALWFYFFDNGRTRYFYYSLPMLYSFFLVWALLIITVLIIVKQKYLDSVGNTFMLLTCLKIGAAYLLLHPILAMRHSEVALEKTNFFITFALFLAFETYIAIRMLNKNR